MIGSFVNNIKSRLTSRVHDESFGISIRSTDDAPGHGFLNKFINASYSLVSQHQDDAYASDNVFMLPRAYSQSTEPCSSPISLRAPVKSVDELDNIVDKFVRCISMENDYDRNVMRSPPPAPSPLIHSVRVFNKQSKTLAPQ
jgi:hypothetical protein